MKLLLLPTNKRGLTKNISIFLLKEITNLPHDPVNHFQDDLVYGAEEVDDHSSALAKWPKDGAEGQAEKDDSESICSRSAGQT